MNYATEKWIQDSIRNIVSCVGSVPQRYDTQKMACVFGVMKKRGSMTQEKVSDTVNKQVFGLVFALAELESVLDEVEKDYGPGYDARACVIVLKKIAELKERLKTVGCGQNVGVHRV